MGLGLAPKYETKERNTRTTNTPAYFDSASVTKKKKFYRMDQMTSLNNRFCGGNESRGQCYKTFLYVNYEFS
jgi:hypothetical protein